MIIQLAPEPRVAVIAFINNPVADHAVILAGFSGHRGAVQCARCGTFLPHYEYNFDTSW